MDKYGTLLHENEIKLHRQYFREMCKLIGIKILYRSPRKDKHYSTYGEIKGNYEEPIEVGCIFNEHPDQRTMKKLGWDNELTTDASLISVSYDLPNLQVGALFEIPSAYDSTASRLFRVTKMSTIMIYPASITCEIVPEYEDVFQKADLNFANTSMTLINREDDNL